MEDLRNCLKTGSPKARDLWNNICEQMENEETAWVEELRKQSYKAAHPNDGWVDRKNNRLYFAYPQFNDGACIGDKVMLGWPGKENIHRLRPVRLVGIHLGCIMHWFIFEDIK